MRRRGETAWRRVCAALAGLTAAALLSACTSPAGPARIEGYTQGAGLAFPGLLLSPDGLVQRRFIFQVHGINTDHDDWGESLLAKIPDYGYKRAKAGDWVDAKLATPKRLLDPPLGCTGNPTCTFAKFGKYRKDVFTRSNPNEEVVVFTYYWRGDLWTITEPYLKADMKDNTDVSFPSTRKSSINAAIKAGLVDNGLSDAAGYLSDIGEMEREGLETALCAMFADAVATNEARAVKPGAGCLEKIYRLPKPVDDRVEFNFLSHSLGSRMLYDVLSGDQMKGPGVRSPDAVAARTAIADRTRTFFMAANQLPLLAVAGITVGDVPAGEGAEGFAPPPPQGVDAGKVTARTLTAKPNSFVNLRNRSSNSKDKGGRRPALTVVAFQDPDDLLGYKASDGVTPNSTRAMQFIDVLHRNTAQYLYLFASPAGAHDHELQEPNSLKMILCGANVDAHGKLSANNCPYGPAG